jgi:hypothetical protein
VKLSRTLILILAVGFAGCAPSGHGPRRPKLPASTGYFDQDSGTDYVHNGDTRVDKALEEDPVPPEQEMPAPSKPADIGSIQPIPVQVGLHDALKEFEISRYDEGAQTPSRFGSSLFRLKMFMKKGMGKSIEFTGKFGGTKPHLTVETDADGYHLSGFIDDQKEQNKGEFWISKGGDSAHIFFWAYRAKMNIREDKMRIPVAGSAIDKQIQSLRGRTFPWVNNWTVANGRSFYMVDIVCLVDADANGKLLPCDSALSFKGESLRTGDQVHEADIVGGNATDVVLVGNSETDPGRSFSVTFADPGTKETNEVMIDIDLDSSSPGVDKPVLPENPPVVDGGGTKPGDTPPADDEEGAPIVPVNAKAVACANGKIVEVTNAEAYLKMDLSNAGAKKIVHDFNQNVCVPGVNDKIKEFQGGGRDGITAFLKYANPFRKIMEVVGSTFDVSPAFAYLTVVESAYFTGGKYKIERPRRKNGTLISSALGPFQILEDTASGSTLGMHVTSLWKGDPDSSDDGADERRFFVPSACGAARYMKYLVGLFDDADRTLAILGYFQGEGGAAAAIHCVYDPSVKDREACVKQINHTFKGSDYGRFMRLAKNYSYSYAEMAKKSAGLTTGMRDYVNGKLAMYFIGNNLSGNAFEIPSDALTGFDDNAKGTVMPSRKLNDDTCEAAVKPVL